MRATSAATSCRAWRRLAGAVVLVGIAIYAVQVGGKGHVVEMGLSIASVAYGALLGVFLLGTLTRYATQFGAIVGMVVGFALNLALYLPKILPVPSLHIGGFALSDIAFTWYVLIGAVVTFTVGSLFSVWGSPSRRKLAAVAPLVLFVFFAANAPAQAAPAYNFSEVDTLMQAALAAKQLPGGVLVIGSGGHVVLTKAYGNRSIDPVVEPLTEDTSTTWRRCRSACPPQLPSCRCTRRQAAV